MAFDDKQSIVLDEEKLRELEEEKKKRRRVGRFMIFIKRFSRSIPGIIGLAIILFIIFLGIAAPLITGAGRIVPYEPEEMDLESQYLPPLSYEPEEIEGDFPIVNKQLSLYKRVIGGIITQEQVTFVNGVGYTTYQQVSYIEIVNRSGTDIWAESPGTLNGTLGQITLTDTTFNGTAYVNYRIGGKIAFKFQGAYTERILRMRIKLAVITDSTEANWLGDLQIIVYEEDSLGSNPIAESVALEGNFIVTGPVTSERSYYFDFRSLKVTAGSYYWAVLDCSIDDVESIGVNQMLYTTADAPGVKFNEDEFQKGWNAVSGWNVGKTRPEDGATPYFLPFRSTNRFHILGTDSLGRDILSASIWGARTSLTVAAIAITIQLLIGVILGAAAGYFGGRIDGIIMRVTDLFLAVPYLFLLLIAVSIWESISLFFIALTIGFFGWSGTARVVRAEFLTLREMEYADAARALGVSNRGIIFRHLLPNALAPVIVLATLNVASVILIEAGLSFLGFGDPAAISWGTAIQWGMTGYTLRFAPWVATIPGIVIFVTVLSFNLVGDALRDALDPRLKR